MKFIFLYKTISSNIRKWFLILENTDFCPQWFTIPFVSFRFDLFRFVSFRFVSFRFDLFRFVPICFVSFRSVSFRSVSFLFRFALYRDPNLRDLAILLFCCSWLHSQVSGTCVNHNSQIALSHKIVLPRDTTEVCKCTIEYKCYNT